MTRQSYFTPCSTTHHSSCLQPGRRLWCPLRQTGSRHDMRTSLLKKCTDKHAAHLWNHSGEGSEMSMLSQPRGFCFTGSCCYQVYCSSTHTHWIVVLGQKSWRWPWLFGWHASRLADCSTGTAVWSSKWMDFLDFDGTGTLQHGWTDMSSLTRRY